MRSHQHPEYEYHKESGDNAVHRLGQHEFAIKRKDKKNAMAIGEALGHLLSRQHQGS